MLEILIPPINTKGSFTFKPPFDTIFKQDQEYIVTSVRSLYDLVDSSEEPFNNIYVPVNLTEDDFKTDLENDVPIVVLKTNGNEYYYVPASYITSIPDTSGVRYQDKIIAINLGSVPVIKNLDLALDAIKQDVYDILGIESEAKVILASAVKLVDKDQDAEWVRLTNNKATVDKSYRTRYLETKELLEDREILINDLQQYIKNNNI